MSVACGPKIVTNGLVMHLDAGNIKSYPGSGTAWNDISGNGRNATLFGSPTFSSTNCGDITFDGVTQGTNVLSGVAQTASWAVSVWAYGITPAVIDSINVYGTLLGTEGNRLLINASNGYFLAEFGAGSHYSTSNVNHIKGKWANVVYVHDDTAHTDAFFINGVHNGTDLTGTTTNLNNFCIAWYGNATYYKFSGKMACLLVYNKALTATEILQNYRANKGRFGL